MAKKTFKEALKGKLTKKQFGIMPRAFDIVGDILIFSEIPKELTSKEKLIGDTILLMYPNVKTVAKKTGQYAGKYRTPKLRIMAGRRKKETIHKENGIRLKLHVEKVYFSPRLCTERKRVMQQVKKGEDVLVMFSGCGPYVCGISKHTGAKNVYGIEINPTAHKYAEENIKLNKLKNVTLFKGDVKKAIPKLDKKFDRIVMPLPKSAEDFLEDAFKAAKKGTIIHFYDFQHENDFPAKTLEKIRKACKEAGIKFRVINKVKCGQYSPGTFRVCVDFRFR